MIRKAKLADCKEINSLISLWAKKGRVLERSLNSIYENIRDFWIYVENDKIVGCCALSVVGWQNLGEVRSLVVTNKVLRQGIGTKLVKSCVEEAKTLGIKKIFALTFVPDFFKKLNFKSIDRKKLPHKIWNACINCIHFPECNEEAVILRIKRRG